MKNPLPPLVWRLVFAVALVAVVLLTKARACDCGVPLVYAAPLAPPQTDSWIFSPARYTHDPETGSRVAQYDPVPPVEPLPDQRAVTSGYSRSRTVVRGADGSVDTYYRVQNYGNGRGGIDAEWERFHDAWRGSTVAGGSFGAYPPYGYGYGGYPGYGYPGGGYPGGAFPGGYPGYGYGAGPGIYPGTPDPRLLDPDGADGFYDQRRRVPDRKFFGPDTRRKDPRFDHRDDHRGGGHGGKKGFPK